MPRVGLIPTTLVTILLTGVTLIQAGWFEARGSQTLASRRAPTTTQVRPADALGSQAAWRWRQGQPAHWRACMLRR